MAGEDILKLIRGIWGAVAHRGDNLVSESTDGAGKGVIFLSKGFD